MAESLAVIFSATFKIGDDKDDKVHRVALNISDFLSTSKQQSNLLLPCHRAPSEGFQASCLCG